MSRTIWPSAVTAIVGAWLVIAPCAIGYAATNARATAGDVLLGIAISAVSTWIATSERVMIAPAWALAFLGVWLLAAPFVLDFRGMLVPLANDIVAGLVTVLLGVVQVTLSADQIEEQV
jgi:hypothetical protein